MADEEDDDLELQPADAGAAFRAEMFATNVLLGYWKHLLAVLVTVLLGFLIYGQWTNWIQKEQRGTTAEIAQALSGLEAPLPVLSELALTDPSFDTSTLAPIAQELVAIGDGASPPAQVEAYLKAAELYRIAGDTDQQRAALEKAAANADDVLRFSAEAALANLELAQEQGDAAEARLRDLMQSQDGFLAQQAALDLALVLEAQERPDEAAQVYRDFLEKWPDSTLAEQVRERSSRLGGAG